MLSLLAFPNGELVADVIAALPNGELVFVLEEPNGVASVWLPAAAPLPPKGLPLGRVFDPRLENGDDPNAADPNPDEPNPEDDDGAVLPKPVDPNAELLELVAVLLAVLAGVDPNPAEPNAPFVEELVPNGELELLVVVKLLLLLVFNDENGEAVEPELPNAPPATALPKGELVAGVPEVLVARLPNEEEPNPLLPPLPVAAIGPVPNPLDPNPALPKARDDEDELPNPALPNPALPKAELLLLVLLPPLPKPVLPKAVLPKAEFVFDAELVSAEVFWNKLVDEEEEEVGAFKFKLNSMYGLALVFGSLLRISVPFWEYLAALLRSWRIY